MKMVAKFHTKEGRKHRKAVLREMKTLSERIAKHARNHLKLLQTRAHETELTEGQLRQISYRIQNVLDQLPAAIAQAHERIIGERQLPNDKLIEDYGIRSGLCPRDVTELSERLENEPGMREGLKRRAGTEARISILLR